MPLTLTFLENVTSIWIVFPSPKTPFDAEETEAATGTSVSTTIFRTFSCDSDFDDGKSYLKADYSVSCHSEEYKVYVAYATFMIFVYPVGIPVLYFILLWRNVSETNPDTERVITAIAEQDESNPIIVAMNKDNSKGYEKLQLMASKVLEIRKISKDLSTQTSDVWDLFTFEWIFDSK